MEKHELAKLESHINSIKSAQADLGTPDGWDELWRIIHQPGWTSVAESALVFSILDSVYNQTRQLAALKNDLLSGARAVGGTQRAAGV